jgi:hypothetical protein
MIIVPRRLLAAPMTMTTRDGIQMERRAFLTALLGGVLAATTAGAALTDERPAAATGALDAQDAEFTQGPPQPRGAGRCDRPGSPWRTQAGAPEELASLSPAHPPAAAAAAPAPRALTARF